MSRRRRITRGPLASGAAGVLACAMIVGGSLLGEGGALAYLLPPLLLLAALAMRRYPGERVLLALMERARPRRRRERSRTRMPGRGARALVPRGGQLIAASLAVRPPPVRLAGSLS